ncbi:exonuclease 3'-5' domain-containing protein 2-like isoform X2 [Ruditapes philippinarum]|uniref:exonuclease 3'-5' domain-containing protein 2-like isoform X2 n=1 Tax=Ruditapes philippinarum TaxID=129788 RepID=UPI00295BD075|nr:exonuclease 3'-5' domain-containing protein 2-like isoform X2 [Ruditapes philippinarum]
MNGENIKKVVVPVAVISVAALWVLYKHLKSTVQQLKFRDKFSREIHVVDTVEKWEKIYIELVRRCTMIKAVGFDCEWVFVGHRLPVALIQIATHDGYCVLVRVFQLKSIPVTLRQFLSDKSILKVGVASRDDGRKLLKDYGIMVSGCVDLRHILARTRAFQCPSQSLQGIAKGVLDVSMVKDQTIRCGDWEAEQLSQEQISYAADDALIGIDVFMHLISVKICGIRSRKQFYGSIINNSEAEVWRTARSLCQGIIDVAFKSKNLSSLLVKGDHSSEDEDFENDIISSSQSSFPHKSGKHKSSKKAFMTRQRPLYYNAQLLAPDGKCLTLCDIRKAQWYLDKGLAVKVGEDPLSVQLKFEPKARPTSSQDYYLQDKENICVVCGADEDYVRKIVVPQEYRKYFPGILKDHSSHDVLLLCINCHLKCADYEAALRQQLSVECDAPLDSGKDSKRFFDQDLAKVVSAAKALLKSRKSIPEARLQELEEIVMRFYGVQSLPSELLESTLNMEIKINNAKFTPHGKKVVEFYMSKEGGLLGFEKMWRQHFIDYMQPQHLPPLWSVEHRPERMKAMDDQE